MYSNKNLQCSAAPQNKTSKQGKAENKNWEEIQEQTENLQHSVIIEKWSLSKFKSTMYYVLEVILTVFENHRKVSKGQFEWDKNQRIIQMRQCEYWFVSLPQKWYIIWIAW